MLKQYKCEHCLLLGPPIAFGYTTPELKLALLIFSATIYLSVQDFQSKASKWWNEFIFISYSTSN